MSIRRRLTKPTEDMRADAAEGSKLGRNRAGRGQARALTLAGQVRDLIVRPVTLGHRCHTRSSAGPGPRPHQKAGVCGTSVSALSSIRSEGGGTVPRWRLMRRVRCTRQDTKFGKRATSGFSNTPDEDEWECVDDTCR